MPECFAHKVTILSYLLLSPSFFRYERYRQMLPKKRYLHDCCEARPLTSLSLTRSCANRCRTSNEHVKEISRKTAESKKETEETLPSFAAEITISLSSRTSEKLPEHELGLKTKREHDGILSPSRECSFLFCPCNKRETTSFDLKAHAVCNTWQPKNQPNRVA